MKINSEDIVPLVPKSNYLESKSHCDYPLYLPQTVADDGNWQCNTTKLSTYDITYGREITLELPKFKIKRSETRHCLVVSLF